MFILFKLIQTNGRSALTADGQGPMSERVVHCRSPKRLGEPTRLVGIAPFSVARDAEFLGETLKNSSLTFFRDEKRR